MFILTYFIRFIMMLSVPFLAMIILEIFQDVKTWGEDEN